MFNEFDFVLIELRIFIKFLKLKIFIKKTNIYITQN